MASLDKRWLALLILCLGDLMIVLDTTIVNVALPSIQSDLGFSQTSLVWVVNAYMLTFSGFLLLGGRLGDLYGRRRLFLAGLVLFTLASLACGLSGSQGFLIAARAVQGAGGAVVSAIAFSLIMNLFTKPYERARAMGFFGFVMAGGGSIGVFLGGILTGALSWHWVFLVNIPIGVLVYVLCLLLLDTHEGQEEVKLDVLGALTITGSLMLAVYGIVGGNTAGWLSLQTLGLLGSAIAVFLLFLFVESRARSPLVPLDVFKKGNIATISIVGVLWSAGMFACFFLSALYMQLVLGYTPLQIGLAFLPSNILMALFSLGVSARLVMLFGVRKNLILGMVLLTIGLLLFAIAPEHASLVMHILPGMLLIGLGAGMAFNPVLLAGTDGIPENESGLASGVLNTAFMMGGSLGLAILASAAAYLTDQLLQGGASQSAALLGGYHVAFFIGALCSGLAALLALRVGEVNAPSETTPMH
jgi:EmrB/QacA subfamily drug resistance transporter